MVQVGDLVAPAGDRGGRRRQAPQAMSPLKKGCGAALVAPAGDSFRRFSGLLATPPP